MKLRRRPLTPLDKMFQGPTVPYSPGSLKKRPEPEPPTSERSEKQHAANACPSRPPSGRKMARRSQNTK